MMSQVIRRLVSPRALGLLAIFIALGGTAYATNQIDGHTIKLGSEPGNRLVDNTVKGKQVKESSLGGSLQRFCQAGAIKGSVVVDTSQAPINAVSATYTTLSGFNCAGGAVQVRKVASGQWYVRFVNNPGTGTAVATGGEALVGVGYKREVDPTLNPTETVFKALVYNTDTGATLDNQTFTLMVF
jgi:hypothetical protein